jgi:3-isopropylmalate dehydrogenase
MTATIALVTGSGGLQALGALQPYVDSVRDVVRCNTIELGVQSFRRTGIPLPEGTLEALRLADAIVMATPPNPGPNDTDIPPGVLEHGIVFALRNELALSINLRRFRGAGQQAGMDIAVVRENSEGAYFAPGDLVHPGLPAEAAAQSVLTTAAAVDHCVRIGFEQADRRRKRLVIAHKVRVLTVSGAIWTRAAERIALEYPDVRWHVESIDTCCGRLIADPGAYDVIATDNVFGDILADVVSARTQAGEYSVSAEYSTSGPSLFEPMHDTYSSADQHARLGHLGLIAAFGAAVSSAGLGSRGDAIQAEVWSQVEKIFANSTSLSPAG